jgi:hypothetical protein
MHGSTCACSNTIVKGSGIEFKVDFASSFSAMKRYLIVLRYQFGGWLERFKAMGKSEGL